MTAFLKLYPMQQIHCNVCYFTHITLHINYMHCKTFHQLKNSQICSWEHLFCVLLPQKPANKRFWLKNPQNGYCFVSNSKILQNCSHLKSPLTKAFSFYPKNLSSKDFSIRNKTIIISRVFRLEALLTGFWGKRMQKRFFPLSRTNLRVLQTTEIFYSLVFVLFKDAT